MVMGLGEMRGKVSEGRELLGWELRGVVAEVAVVE